MVTDITNSLLSQLKPKSKPYDVRDKKLVGFFIRVNISGKLVYMCEYARGKRMMVGRVGTITLMQAKERARKILADATHGIDPKNRGLSHSHEEKAKITLKNFIDDKYLPWVISHRKTGLATVKQIRRCFFKDFGEQPLNLITKLAIEDWRTKRLKQGISRETANRNVAVLKAALSKAVEWELLEVHPLAKLKLLRTDSNIKIRYLDKAEEIQLRKALDKRENILKENRSNANQWREKRNYSLLPALNALTFSDYLKPMVLISINTGLRRGELFDLTWENVDFDKALLTITGATAKSEKTRHVPLNKEALQTLQQWQSQQSELSKLVFPNKQGKRFDNVKKAWSKIVKDAKIDHFRWHDLRHHFASKLVMAGVDLNTVRELLGHADIKMTLRYAHLAPGHKAEAVAKLNWE